MTFRLLSILLVTVFASCETQTSFDSIKWKQNYDIVPHPDRARMVKDLLSRRLLIGMDTSSVNHLLGEPESKEQDSYTYPVMIDYGTDIDPVATEDLVLIFARGRVDSVFVRSWRKGQ